MAADHLKLARKIRTAGEQAGHSRIATIQAIQGECEVSPLRAHRYYTGKSAGVLAEELGISRQQLLKLETGAHKPEYDLLDRICRLLHTNPLRLGLFTDYTPGDEQEQSDTREEDSRVLTGDIVENGHNASREEDPTDRRDLLVGLAATPLGLTLQELRLGSEQLFSEQSITQNSLDDWQDAAEVYYIRLRTEPPTSVLKDLSAEYAEIAYHLKRRQPLEVQRELSHLAAQYATFIAWALGDLRQHREARHWRSIARTAADESADDRLRARVVQIQAYDAMYAGRPLGEVVKLAQQSQRLTHGNPCPTLGSILNQGVDLVSVGRRMC